MESSRGREAFLEDIGFNWSLADTLVTTQGCDSREITRRATAGTVQVVDRNRRIGLNSGIAQIGGHSLPWPSTKAIY